jgi:hypothetical protein
MDANTSLQLLAPSDALRKNGRYLPRCAAVSNSSPRPLPAPSPLHPDPGYWLDGRSPPPDCLRYQPECVACARSLFSPIEASLAAGFGRLHALTVDDPGTRFRMSSCLLPRSCTEGIVHPDEGAVERPVVRTRPQSRVLGKATWEPRRVAW